MTSPAQNAVPAPRLPRTSRMWLARLLGGPVRRASPISRGDALGRLANQGALVLRDGAVVLTPLGAAVALTLRGAS